MFLLLLFFGLVVSQILLLYWVAFLLLHEVYLMRWWYYEQRRRGRVAVCGGQIKDEDRAGMGMDGRPGRQAGRGAAGKKRRPL